MQDEIFIFFYKIKKSLGIA